MCWKTRLCVHTAAPKRSAAENRHFAAVLFYFKDGLNPFVFVLGLMPMQGHLCTGKVMVWGSLGQQVGMETAPGDASPCASVFPLVKQGYDVQYNPRKGGEGLELEPVFLKPVPQPSCCKVPLAEGGDKVTQGAVQGWWRTNPEMGMQPQTRTPEHPSAGMQEPFCKPSAPPSVPTVFLGFVSAHPRHVWSRRVASGPRDGDSSTCRACGDAGLQRVGAGFLLLKVNNYQGLNWLSSPGVGF